MAIPVHSLDQAYALEERLAVEGGESGNAEDCWAVSSEAQAACEPFQPAGIRCRSRNAIRDQVDVRAAKLAARLKVCFVLTTVNDQITTTRKMYLWIRPAALGEYDGLSHQPGHDPCEEMTVGIERMKYVRLFAPHNATQLSKHAKGVEAVEIEMVKLQATLPQHR
jgi:hypothetical protein